MTARKQGLFTDKRGTTAVEFAIVGPIIFALMFWFFDLGFSVYVRNSFAHAVNEIARDVYLDPDVTDESLQAMLEAKVSGYGDDVAVASSTQTVGSIDYHIISAQMIYRFKAPPFSDTPVTLRAEGRAPVIDYQVEEEG